MIDFLNSIKSFYKFEDINIDNNVFKLHYRFTVGILVGFSILLSSRQYFGEPINCDADEKKDLVNTYCWVFSTYILKSTSAKEVLPGLGNAINENDTVWQTYYQWVSIIFALQAVLFYVPRYVWKIWEGGRLRLLVKDLNSPLVSPNWNASTKHDVVQYLLSGRYSHNLYAIRFIICEYLNLLNLICQLCFMDWLLTGKFTMYGISVVLSEQTNPMGRVFPKMAKCLMYRFGPSGTQEVRDTLCILPLNLLNEKLFLIFWVWLFLLFIVTIVSIIYRMLVILSRKIRIYLILSQMRYVNKKQITYVMNELSYGDFFVLYQIGKNVNQLVFKEIVLELYEIVKLKKPYRYFNDIEIIHN